MIVFDLDGVLADTRAIVREAYQRAGVHMPDWAWGQPWEMWLQNPFVHARKQELYHGMIRARLVKPLSGLDLLLWARETWPVGILTSSSEESAKMLVHSFGLAEDTLLGAGCSADEKREQLQLAQAKVYVDDIATNAPITDRICGFVHYVPGTEDRMMKEIRQWMQ